MAVTLSTATRDMGLRQQQQQQRRSLRQSQQLASLTRSLCNSGGTSPRQRAWQLRKQAQQGEERNDNNHDDDDDDDNNNNDAPSTWTAATTATTPYTLDGLYSPTDEESLRKVVHKHCATLDTYLTQRPVAAHTQEAFRAVEEWLATTFPSADDEQRDGGPLIILDSCCGTGRSSILLAQRYPNAAVIGIDKSLVRLERNLHYRQDNHHGAENDNKPRNLLLVRAEVTDFWRLLMLGKRWRIQHHYLLYPNPYPKSIRWKSRWYAHSSFPLLLKTLHLLGDDDDDAKDMGNGDPYGATTFLVVRSNWWSYLEEFAVAVAHAQEYYRENTAAPFSFLQNVVAEGPYRYSLEKDVGAWTNFEQKFQNVGEPLYELRIVHDKVT